MLRKHEDPEPIKKLFKDKSFDRKSELYIIQSTLVEEEEMSAGEKIKNEGAGVKLKKGEGKRMYFPENGVKCFIIASFLVINSKCKIGKKSLMCVCVWGGVMI